MWPYERLLPDYDPKKKANVKQKIRSQPIFSHRRTTHVSSSNEGEPMRPSDKIKRQYGQVHADHIHALSNYWLGPHLGLQWKAAPHGASPSQLRKIAAHNEDIKAMTEGNRHWFKFREKQVHLHQLEHQLDNMREEQAALQCAARAKPDLPNPHMPELQTELESVKQSIKILKERMHDTVNSRLLELDWQRRLEEELKAYFQYARDHNRVLKADPHMVATADNAYREWDRFRQDRNCLRDLQQQLDLVKTESLKLEQAHAEARKSGNRNCLPSARGDLLKTEHEGDRLECKVRSLLVHAESGARSGMPTNDPHVARADPKPLAACWWRKLKQEHLEYTKRVRTRDRELDNLRHQRTRRDDGQPSPLDASGRPASWMADLTEELDRSPPPVQLNLKPRLPAHSCTSSGDDAGTGSERHALFSSSSRRSSDSQRSSGRFTESS